MKNMTMSGSGGLGSHGCNKTEMYNFNGLLTQFLNTFQDILCITTSFDMVY